MLIAAGARPGGRAARAQPSHTHCTTSQTPNLGGVQRRVRRALGVDLEHGAAAREPKHEVERRAVVADEHAGRLEQLVVDVLLFWGIGVQNMPPSKFLTQVTQTKKQNKTKKDSRQWSA